MGRSRSSSSTSRPSNSNSNSNSKSSNSNKQKIITTPVPLPPPPPPATASPVAASPVANGGIKSAVVEGLGFGAGSAIAHHVIDSIMGPKKIVHEHHEVYKNTHSQQDDHDSISKHNNNNYNNYNNNNNMCTAEKIKLSECMIENNHQINSCLFFKDVLSQCETDVYNNTSNIKQH